jgi:fermentation-respiration switch protein FrsA (DUF1100 family)
VKRLLLRAPSLASEDERHAGWREPIVSQLPQVEPQFDSLAILARYPGQVLILESANDEVIPHEYIAAYLRASSAAELEVIPDATHALSNPKWNKAFVKAIIRWFRDL